MPRSNDASVRLPELTPGIPRFLLVAPVLEMRDSMPVLYSLPQDSLREKVTGTQVELAHRFMSRDNANAPFTRLDDFVEVSQKSVEEAASRAYRARKAGTDIGPEFRFAIHSAEVYRHFGMDMMVAFVELARPDRSPERRFMDWRRTDVEQFEQATYRLMEKLCEEHFGEASTRVPRWVSRTAILFASDEHAFPESWSQQSVAKQVELDQCVHVSVGWANGAAQTMDAQYQFIDLRRSLAMAQYLWCFVADIDSQSVEVLAGINERHASNREHDRMLDQISDLNYDLAALSMFYERLGTESSVANREVVVSTLEAWGYPNVMRQIADRLHRLESIVSARSDKLARSTSRVMERILFIVSLTGLVSLTLGFIGTAYSGESGSSEPWFAESRVLDWFRSLNADLMLGVTAALSFLLMVLVWSAASPRHERRRK